MVMALLCGLSACAEQSPFLTKNSDGSVSRTASSFEQNDSEAASPIIAALLERRSLLEEGSIYREVGEAAISASARASEAELISAKLRAEAKAKNWLPTIGPSVSLTDLGDLVAGILVEQILFDNGRRKAEREFAAADVEVAAVNLSIDMNTRVQTAVGL
jgi:adhesin transport system outer membrane protein